MLSETAFRRCFSSLCTDGNSWVHKASYGCAREVVNKLPTDGYILYVLRRTLLLKQAGIEPIVVFDGAKPPLKAEVEAQRNNSRGAEALRGQEYDKKAAQYPKSSADFRFNTSRADECYQRAVRVNQKMVSATMHALRAAGVQCLVAPFEADAQLVWLALHKKITAIITEDSDLSVFLVAVGAEAALWFKMTQHGHAWELQVTKQGTQPWADLAQAHAAHHADLRLAVEQAAGSAAAPIAAPSPIADSPSLDDSIVSTTSSTLNSSAGSAAALTDAVLRDGVANAAVPSKTPSRRRRLLGSHWTPKAPSRGADLLGLLSRCSPHQYTTVAVMAGCDYLASLPGVGLITAAKLAFKFRSARGLRLVRFAAEHVGKKLRAKGAAPPSDYRKRAAQAIACFKHHLVWDTDNHRVVPLTPLQHEVFEYHDAVGATVPSMSTPPASTPVSTGASDDSDSIHSTQSQPEDCSAVPSTPPSGGRADPYAASLRWLRHDSWAFLGNQVEGAMAHRITRGEVHPTSLATISPAKLAPAPGAARASPGARAAGKRARATAAAPDAGQRSIMGLFTSGKQRATGGRNTAPTFTLAVAGLVSAIAGGGGIGSCAPPHGEAHTAGPGKKPIPRVLWGGSGAKPASRTAPTTAPPALSPAAPPALSPTAPPALSPAAPPATEPTLPPELEELLLASNASASTPTTAVSSAAGQSVSSLAAAFSGSSAPSRPAVAAAALPPPAGQGSHLAAVGHAARLRGSSPLQDVQEDADVVLLSSQSPGAVLSPAVQVQAAKHSATPGARAGPTSRAAGRKVQRTSLGTTPAGTRSIASFFGGK